MFNSLVSQNDEALDKSDLFPLEYSHFDLNNFLLDKLPFSKDELENQEIFKFQPDLLGIKRNRNGSLSISLNEENSSWDKLNIEIPSHPIYPTDNIQKEDKTLFAVYTDAGRRGRKSLRIEGKYARKHDKYSDDNIKRKIIGHFINNILKYINRISLQNGYDEQLYKISSISKQKENKKNFLSLKNMKIEQILSQDISPKYKKETNKKINADLIEKIKEEPNILKILSADFVKVFRELYYYEKEAKLDLPKDIETYKDLVNKNKNDSLYIKRLDECIHKYFLC